MGAGDKYPYDPFYGSFSPRVGVAWNPSFSKATVVRGGYGRIYGRLNGVDLVLVPLLGVGLIQAVHCRQTFMNGTCGRTQSDGGQCIPRRRGRQHRSAASGGPDPAPAGLSGI